MPNWSAARIPKVELCRRLVFSHTIGLPSLLKLRRQIGIAELREVTLEVDAEAHVHCRLHGNSAISISRLPRPPSLPTATRGGQRSRFAFAAPLFCGIGDLTTRRTRYPRLRPFIAPDPTRSTQVQRRRQLGSAGPLHRWRGADWAVGGAAQGDRIRL